MKSYQIFSFIRQGKFVNAGNLEFPHNKNLGKFSQ